MIQISLSGYFTFHLQFLLLQPAFYHEYSGPIENHVQSCQKVILSIEEFLPLGRLPVTGKDHCAWALLGIPPVDHIKKHHCILMIEMAPPNLINNRTSRFHKTGDDPRFTAVFSCCGELII